MDATTIALLLVGFLLLFCGCLVLLVRAFQESIGWGIASLVIPFANIVFAFGHWDRTKGSFLCTIIGTAIFVGGAVKAGVSSEAGFTQALKGGLLSESGHSAEELTASVQERRARIELLETQFATQGSDLAKQYAALELRRTKLNTADTAALERFNADAAVYQTQNAAHKATAQELETAREQLVTLLDERSRLQKVETPGPSGKNVVMYTTASCPACVAAKSYFARQGIPYDERNVDASPAALEEFRRLGGRGVPLIIVGNERMEGFSAQR